MSGVFWTCFEVDQDVPRGAGVLEVPYEEFLKGNIEGWFGIEIQYEDGLLDGVQGVLDRLGVEDCSKLVGAAFSTVIYSTIGCS